MRRTVPPSAEIEEQIDALLAVGVGENPREALSELAKLGARLIIQRAVEDEFDAWLGRARYERRPGGGRAHGGAAQRVPPRRVQTAEGELAVEIPQVREAAEPFVSKLFPRGTKLLRTEPLKAMVIGAFVGPLDARRRVAVRAGRAGEALEIDRLADLQRVARALRGVRAPRPLRHPPGGAVRGRHLPRCAPRRAQGGRAGRLGLHRSRRAGAFGGDAGDARVPRGLAGARARSDRPRARRADADRRRRRPRADEGDRAVLARLRPPALRRSPPPQPARQAARTRARTRPPGLLAGARRRHQRARRKQRLQTLVDELDRAGYTAAARCLADDLDALVVHLRYPTRHRRRWRRRTCSNDRSARSSGARR